MMLTEKKCPDCLEVKGAEFFSKDKSKKTGLATYCKGCQAVRMSRYYPKNADKMRKRARDWYADNTERHRATSKAWLGQNKERYLATRRKYHARRKKTDVLYALDFVMRASVRRLVSKGGKSHKLGYSAESLKQRIECQFKPGMSWENYGEWEIDHKIPMSLMMARGEVSPYIINALSNLQPMWRANNRAKGARWIG